MDLKKSLIADLHIHSRFSRATSKSLDIPNLVKWARVKGVGLLGTGDFTHPEWLQEIGELEEDRGIYYYKDEVGKFPFILTSEISLIYTQEGSGRMVHLVMLAPNLEAVNKINAWLDTKGRRDYDGRPIFKISCRDFAAKMQEIDEKIEVIPAHIWTPYFGVFGSKKGFDSLEQAFGDKVDRIHAIETGISSDPEMNWKIKSLDNISIVSFSDLHSFWPWRLGREATIFNNSEDLTYDYILRQIREHSFIGTIETDPAYGKYHFDGHRDCDFSCSPEETKRLKGVCPKCGKQLTVGVDFRVGELALKQESNNQFKKEFYRILPLHELIAVVVGMGMNTKACWTIYNNLIAKFGSEFEILLNTDEKELVKALPEHLQLVDLILKNRVGKIHVKPGYDGEYGVLELGGKQEKLF